MNSDQPSLQWRAVLDELRKAHGESPLANRASLAKLAPVFAQQPEPQHSETWFQCITEFARLCYASGCARLALDPVSEAAALASQLAATVQRRLMLTLLGVLQIDAGNFPASLAALAEALDLCKQLNDPSATASVLINTSTALIDSDFADYSYPACRDALAQARAVIDPHLSLIHI